MGKIKDVPVFEPNIYLIEKNDYIIGGTKGTANIQANQLANRTRWLYDKLAVLFEMVSGSSTYTIPLPTISLEGTISATVTKNNTTGTIVMKTSIPDLIVNGMRYYKMGSNNNFVGSVHLANNNIGISLCSDEQFSSSNNSLTPLHTNLASITIDNISNTRAPNTSRKTLKVSLTEVDSVGYGGVQPTITTLNDSLYLVSFTAKLPTGYRFNVPPSSDLDSTELWLSDNVGTNRFEQYVVQHITNSNGTNTNVGQIIVSDDTGLNVQTPPTFEIATYNVYNKSASSADAVKSILGTSDAVTQSGSGQTLQNNLKLTATPTDPKDIVTKEFVEAMYSTLATTVSDPNALASIHNIGDFPTAVTPSDLAKLEGIKDLTDSLKNILDGKLDKINCVIPIDAKATTQPITDKSDKIATTQFTDDKVKTSLTDFIQTNLFGAKQSLQPYGYAHFLNNLIFQWGTKDVGINSNVSITYPITYPNQCLMTIPVATYTTNTTKPISVSISNETATGCDIRYDWIVGSNPEPTKIKWISIGF